MKVFLSITVSIVLFVLFIPVAKIYQLKGYKINNFLESMMKIKYSFGGKNKLIFTKRMIRFLILFLLFEFLLWFLLISKINFWWLLILDFCLNILFFCPILTFLHYIILPIEICVQRYYLLLTKKKLSKFKGIKVAITGSFGKTSTKNILTQLLKNKFRVCVSPKNFNTPMGLAKTVLKELNLDDEVLIVEMGARHKGDIKYLCDILKPDIGILTSVGEQHIESFKSLENVMETKFELCQSLIGKTCYFDCCNENTEKLFEKASCKKIALKHDMIKKIKLTSIGAKFELATCDREIKLSTKLLGKNMIKNISLATLVAMDMGIGESQIIRTVKDLLPTKHRLELMCQENFTIIDDSYNSNFYGFKEALEIVDKFSGEKIIVTPGLVELGQKQYEFNFKLGKEIAKVCDKAIIMNKTNKKALSEGVISQKKDFNLHYADDREEQRKLLKTIVTKNSVVLFENDLPDDYA